MTRNKRTILLALALAFVVFPLCATVTGPAYTLRTVSTEHFDIIYEKGNDQTAALIYDNCEQIYESLVQYYNKDPQLHIPVVITCQYKVLNAYYTSYPANRIVLFDTVGEVGSLSNFPDSLTSIFRHELVHAFQSNMRGPFIQSMATVFGDIVSLSTLLYMTPALSEGGAVLNESLDGYGRLNDSYAMQIVRQAKIESLFPQWIDIAGARDTYPSGLLYYNFAGAFLGYLTLTYGQDTVSDLYVNFGQPGWFTTANSIIKKHIGKSVKEAWNDFYEWVEIPEDIRSYDVLESHSDYGLYSDLYLSDLENVYVYDKTSWSILKFSPDLSTCSTVMVSPTSYPSLSVSDDSICLILVPEVLENRSSMKLMNSGVSKYGRLVYRFSDSVRDIRDGAIVRMGNAKYVLLYSNKGQTTYLDLYDMIEYSPVPGKSIELGYGVVASDFCDAGSSRVAFLVSIQSHDYVAVLDLETMEITLVENPIDAQLTSLCTGSDGQDSVLCFTWYPSGTDQASLGCYGELNVDTMYVRLASTNVSGSMNSALRIGEQVVFVSGLYEGQKLSSIPYNELQFSLEGFLTSSAFTTSEAPLSSQIADLAGRYKPMKYFKDGVLLPAGALTFGYATYDIGLGASWITVDPTETYGIMATAGYGFFGPFAGLQFASTSILPYSIYASYNYEVSSKSHWLETGFDLSQSYTLRHAGESLDLYERFDYHFTFLPSGEVHRGVNNTLSATYSHYSDYAMGPYGSGGFSFTASLSNLDPEVGFSVLVPHILPFESKGKWTLNWPLSAGLSAYYDISRQSFALNGNAKITVLSYEIQKGIQFMGLYFKRVIAEAQYAASYDTLTKTFAQTFTASA